MAKECIYLTDITLHVSIKRQTTNFSKVAEKGRFFNPLPPKAFEGDGETKRITFELPKDLKDRVQRGEVEIMIPKDGLPMFAGKDVVEKVAKMQKAERRLLIHHGRNKTWRA